MDDLGDLTKICDIKPFDEIYISTDDDESMPQITDVCSLRNDTLPEASKVKYNRIYHDFKNWQKKKDVNKISETLVMEYFRELSVKQKPTSLWAYYSMLKRTFQVNLSTDISSYNQVLAFLKANSSGYEPVKSKNFTLEEVVKFVVEAPDEALLDVKTICIFGVCGSLKNSELRGIKFNDVEPHGDILLVRVEDSNSKTYRSFTITGDFSNIVKKYVALRPSHAPLDRFFLNYQRGKCTIQPIGKNKFSRMPYRIAQYLKLSEPDRYTGQAFRLSGQAILKNASQTIDRRMIEAIARNYSPHSSSSDAQSMSQIDDDDNLIDVQETVFKLECKDIEPESDNSTEDNFLKVDNLRIHCTVCDVHLGSSVVNEDNIHTHPILLVTQCQNCHVYYNRRDFTKGASGSELQCRWCAQGGEVYSCSKCPYVFCRKCILQNLSKSVITNVERNDGWRCFSCAPGAVSHLQAQHLALINHLRQRKDLIRDMNDADQLDELMYEDLTLCCKGKEPLNVRQNPKDKRRRPGDKISAPEPKRIRNHSIVRQSPTPPTILSKNLDTPPLILNRQISTSSTEPSSLIPRSMHSSTSERSVSPLTVIDFPLSSSAVAVFPNNQSPTVAQVASSSYQTYNILVDLTAKEDTFVRLPNGKLIQVSPQTVVAEAMQQMAETLHQTPPVLMQNHSPPIAVTDQTITAATVSQPSLQFINVGMPMQQQCLQSTQQLQNFPLQQTFQPPLQIIEVDHQKPSPPQAKQQQLTLPTQQSTQRRSSTQLVSKPQHPAPPSKKYPNTPLGQAQTVLEKEVHNVQEICQQIVGKCSALMKSNAYNSVQSFNDVRDLHQHLAYLCAYASSRFDTLKNKCTGAMGSLTSAQVEVAKSLAEKDNKCGVTEENDDDVQVLEPVTECIEIDSEDEGESKTVENDQTDNRSNQVDGSAMNLQSTGDVNETADKNELGLTKPAVLATDEGPYDYYDEKLKGWPVVLLEKDERTERKLEEFLERQNSDNGVTGATQALESAVSNAVYVTCNNRNDDEMVNCVGDTSDPNDVDQQAKDEIKMKSLGHKELDSKVETELQIDNKSNEENDNKRDYGARVDRFESNFNLDGEQSPQCTINLDINSLDAINQQNSLSNNSLENVLPTDTFVNMLQNTGAGETNEFLNENF